MKNTVQNGVPARNACPALAHSQEHPLSIKPSANLPTPNVCPLCPQPAPAVAMTLRQVSHLCDVCGRRNHVICGIPIDEGFGGSVRCIGCVPSLQSSWGLETVAEARIEPGAVSWARRSKPLHQIVPLTNTDHLVCEKHRLNVNQVQTVFGRGGSNCGVFA
jgi:hypothetical protein